ncbi:MAG: RelA/SpoT family protein [Bacteroidales bacterium]|jgi:GTP pyrophosphokinase|nr:RelA/SpoT family protein [Bacteroidales bacterium]
MYIVDEELEKKEILSRYKYLLKLIKNKATRQEKTEVRKAFVVANNAHKGVRRKTGEPYIYHPLEVSRIAVEDLELGATSIVCALLHDVVEDTEYTLEDIKNIFGDKVANIIDGLTKIDDIFDDKTKSLQAENFKKLIISMGDDIRVILLKLCDRLHNMRTLDSMPDTKRYKIASETQTIYVPLSHRLGLYKIKSELEDLCTKYFDTKDYNKILKELKNTEKERQEFVDKFTEPIKEKLTLEGYKFTCSERIKTITSILGKMKKKGVSFKQIYDIFAIRIVLDVPREKEIQACEDVYNIIKTEYPKTAKDRKRDWLETPKANGYEALHDTFVAPNGRNVEVQIRSKRMDDIAETGLAAHYKYKEVEEGKVDANLDIWLTRIRELLDNRGDNAVDFINDFKLNLFTDEIKTYTPKGKEIILPKGSSVLDFAFTVHTDLGIKCIGAKINYKLVPIDYKLSPYDQVEIISSNNAYPKEEYLSFVKTLIAVQTIKTCVRKYKKTFYEDGENKLRDLFKKLSIESNDTNVDRLMKAEMISNKIDFFYKISQKEIGEENIRLCFNKKKRGKNYSWMFLKIPFNLKNDKSKNKNNTLKEEIHQQIANNPENVLIKGDLDNIKYVTASCCNPVPGDDIVGLIENNSIIVHRTNCSKAIDEMSIYGNRIVKAKWRENEKLTFLAGISVQGLDRKGLLQELTGVISEIWNINIRGLAMESSEGLFNGTIMVYIYDTKQLEKLISNIKKIDGIESVKRI